MSPDKLSKLWAGYLSRPVNTMIHKDDLMYNTAQKPEHYHYCGESGAKVVWSVLGLAPIENCQRILDFGCGHGRVGRYLRRLFPEADIMFADVDVSGVEFCASQFTGVGYITPKDFTQLNFEMTFDLIWLGSVFTHIDYDRMAVLFDKLFSQLSNGGCLIGTFRGHKMYQTYLRSPEVAKRDADLIREYEAGGVAYKRYPGWVDDWGLSLVSPQKLIELGQSNPNARLIAYCETGWASAHDVIAWSNTNPVTVIR